MGFAGERLEVGQQFVVFHASCCVYGSGKERSGTLHGEEECEDHFEYDFPAVDQKQV